MIEDLNIKGEIQSVGCVINAYAGAAGIYGADERGRGSEDYGRRTNIIRWDCRYC